MRTYLVVIDETEEARLALGDTECRQLYWLRHTGLYLLPQRRLKEGV